MMITSNNIVRLKTPPLEVADIFRRYAADYTRTYAVPLAHLKVMHALSVCRTKELGGIEKNVTGAVLRSKLIIPAAIAIAPSANPSPKLHGLRSENPNFYQLIISTMYLPCPMK